MTTDDLRAFATFMDGLNALTRETDVEFVPWGEGVRVSRNGTSLDFHIKLKGNGLHNSYSVETP